MPRINVRAEQRRLDKGIRRTLILDADADLRSLRKRRVFYDIPEGVTARQELLDAYVAPVLMLAMAEKTDLFFRGPLSRAMAYNAHEFMKVWATWRPEVFSPIEIDAESIVDAPRRAPARAIQAFSGGLDALFTTWTHKLGGRCWRADRWRPACWSMDLTYRCMTIPACSLPMTRAGWFWTASACLCIG